MKTHNYAQIECLKKKFPYYDFDNLSITGGTTYVIKASEEHDNIQYGDIELGNCSVEDFCKLETILLNFFFCLLDAIQEEECTIIKYEPKWVVRESETPELSCLLHKNSINNDVYGITVNKHDALVKEFVTSSFRYNSFIQLLFSCKNIVITPTDHMDIFLDLPASSSLINEVNLVLCGKEPTLLPGQYTLGTLGTVPLSHLKRHEGGSSVH